MVGQNLGEQKMNPARLGAALTFPIGMFPRVTVSVRSASRGPQTC
jgi:hypothetical protein